MKIALHIVNSLNLRFCSHFELEFVDEHKTLLKIKNFNKRGERDKISVGILHKGRLDILSYLFQELGKKIKIDQKPLEVVFKVKLLS